MGPAEPLDALRKKSNPQPLGDPRSLGSQKDIEAFSLHSNRPSGKPINILALAQALWPLAAHGALSMGVAIFVIFYIDQHHFNNSNRRPNVRLHDGTIVSWAHFALLQTDVTTLLSIQMAVLRLITAGWLGSLCWRCAFILMEILGMKPEQLRNMVTYGIVPPPMSRIYKEGKQRANLWLIWVIMLISLPPQIAAPLLTGSITWVAGYHPPQRQSDVNISTRLVGTINRWAGWSRFSTGRQEWAARYAASRAFLSWGWDPKNDVLKRFVPEFSVLEIGSVVANITIPYFIVHSIEWVDDPQLTLSTSSIRDSRDACSRIMAASSICPLVSIGTVAFIPDTPPSNQTELYPSKVSEKRLMWHYVGATLPTRTSCAREWDKIISHNLSPNRGIYQEGTNCYRFAWVRYTAGASICRNGRISSYATVQNHTALEPIEDFVTDPALRLMPTVANLMLDKSKMDDMIPTWNTLDDFVVGMLTRSYSTSWMALTELLDPGFRATLPRNTTYLVSPPASQALVNLSRVYVWLGLQSLITLSGVLLIIVQSRTDTSTIIDVRLTAFYLDTSAVSELDEPYSITRRVEFEEGYLKIRTD